MFKITVNIINTFLKFFYTLDIEDILAKKPKQSDLVHFLAEINDKWETIGTALDVQSSVLRGLRHSNEDNTVKLIRVIGSWLDTMPTETTWKVVIAAIEGPIVNHRATGMEIRKFLAKQYNVTWVDYI